MMLVGPPVDEELVAVELDPLPPVPEADEDVPVPSGSASSQAAAVHPIARTPATLKATRREPRQENPVVVLRIPRSYPNREGAWFQKCRPSFVACDGAAARARGAAGSQGPPFLSSVSTSFATAFNVSKTP